MRVPYDYGFRIYNPAIARFLSVDPLSPDYLWYTPYQFAGNKPIIAVDLDGLEENINIDGDVVYSGVPELSIPVITSTHMSQFEKAINHIDRVVNYNRFQGWQPMGCDCGLSSNVPTSGARGDASDVVNITTTMIGGTLLAPLSAGVSGSFALSDITLASSWLASNAAEGGALRFGIDFGVQAGMNSIQGKSVLSNYNIIGGIAAAYFPVGNSSTLSSLSLSTFQKGVLTGAVTGGVGVGLNWTPNDLSEFNGPSVSLLGGVSGATLGGVFGGVGGLLDDVPKLNQFYELPPLGSLSEHPLLQALDAALEGFESSIGTIIDNMVDDESEEK